MATSNLPIDIVPGTSPPRFRWRQSVDTPIGRQVVDHEEGLPVIVEVAIVRLIGVARQLMMENATLHGTIDGLNERISQQNEGKPAQQATPKKGR